MKVFHVVLMIGLCNFLIGCSGSDSDSDSVSLEGKWYNAEADLYLVILNNNTVMVRECSVNDGYRITETIELIGNTLSIENNTYVFQRTGSVLTITLEGTTTSTIYSLETLIPTVCEGDAIEITFSSPETATEGLLTNFVVNFDYRLASTSNAIINLGFNTDSSNVFVLSNSSLAITQAEVSSGSLSADALPAFYNSPESFKVYVILSDNPHPAPWTPLSSDTVDVVVTQ